MKKYLVEIIGTFFLVLTVVTTAFIQSPMAAFAIASVLIVMVYAGSHISGGHYNPAVSLAYCIRGTLEKKELLPYVIAQLIGGALAVCVLKIAAPTSVSFEPSDYVLKSLLIAEFLFTFLLCYVVLQTTTTKNTNPNSYYGIVIGFTFLVGILSVGGSFCIAAFNPAIAVSVAILNMLTMKLLVFTVFANLLAAVCSALFFRFVYNEE